MSAEPLHDGADRQICTNAGPRSRSVVLTAVAIAIGIAVALSYAAWIGRLSPERQSIDIQVRSATEEGRIVTAGDIPTGVDAVRPAPSGKP